MSVADDPTSPDEHKRYLAFQSRVAALERLSNDLLESLIAEVAADPDVSMRGSVLALIAEHRSLSEDQLESLLSHPHYQQPFLQHRIQRARLMLQLREKAPSDSVLARCMSFADASIHRALLSHPAVRRPHLELLRAIGANRAIRNSAAQLLQAHRHE